MTLRTLKLTLAYHGAAFHGWQRQPATRTVQETVELAAMRIVRTPLSVVGASRTDAGVHALGQVAHLRTDCPIAAEKLLAAIGNALPDDVALVDLVDAPPAFHAIRHARGKLYRYTIHNDDSRPVEDQMLGRAWHVWFAIDIDRMRAAAQYLLGRHDFRSFAGLGAPREDNVRTIERICIRRHLRRVEIDIEGDGFLYNMVRIITGTLVEIGRGHWPVERMPEILAAQDRRAAGPTAPPEGLTLRWVKYPPMARIEEDETQRHRGTEKSDAET